MSRSGDRSFMSANGSQLTCPMKCEIVCEDFAFFIDSHRRTRDETHATRARLISIWSGSTVCLRATRGTQRQEIGFLPSANSNSSLIGYTRLSSSNTYSPSEKSNQTISSTREAYINRSKIYTVYDQLINILIKFQT